MPASSLDAAFPAPEAIPERFRHRPDETGLTLLVGGRLSRWDGPSQKVRSAVWVREAEGALSPLELGPAAQASAELARAAAEAASAAWKGGRGEWPRASAEERIGCVGEFLRRAAPLREAVARTLMWEVGKPYADCLVEFDRTIKYIEDTMETLRRAEQEASAQQVAVSSGPRGGPSPRDRQ